MLVGQTYKLEFSGPFAGANDTEVVLEAITSARTLVDYSVDVYTSIFESVGLTRANYEEWLAGEKLIYTFRKGDVIYKVPSGYFTEAPLITTVPYRQYLLVAELPYLTASEIAEVSGILDDIKDFFLRRHGLEVELTYKGYGKTVDVNEEESTNIQTQRIERKALALTDDVAPETLRSINADLQVKLEGLEEIIILKQLA